MPHLRLIPLLCLAACAGAPRQSATEKTDQSQPTVPVSTRELEEPPRVAPEGRSSEAGALSSSPGVNDSPKPRVRPMVGPHPEPVSPEDTFSFLVGGHLYGDARVVGAVPSPTFLAAMVPLRAGPDRFLVSVGDVLQSFEEPGLIATGEVFTFFEKPVFNAPGNHDYRAGRYEDRFGPSYGTYRCGNSLFVLLNTEITPWNIAGAQLAFLRRTVDWALEREDVENVFVFAHKVIFAAGEPRYAPLFRNCNGRDGWDGDNNFHTEVLPLLRRLADHKHVAWFAGDIGAEWGFSLFYDRHPDWGVTFVASGLGATERDCLLRVHVTPGKDPRIEPVPLQAGATHETGDPISEDISTYGIGFWRRRFAVR